MYLCVFIYVCASVCVRVCVLFFGGGRRDPTTTTDTPTPHKFHPNLAQKQWGENNQQHPQAVTFDGVARLAAKAAGKGAWAWTWGGRMDVLNRNMSTPETRQRPCTVDTTFSKPHAHTPTHHTQHPMHFNKLLTDPSLTSS